MDPVQMIALDTVNSLEYNKKLLDLIHCTLAKYILEYKVSITFHNFVIACRFDSDCYNLNLPMKCCEYIGLGNHRHCCPRRSGRSSNVTITENQ